MEKIYIKIKFPKKKKDRKDPVKKYNLRNGSQLIKGNSLDILRTFESNSFDLIIADPPYFLSNGGMTCKSGKMALVNKGEWDQFSDMDLFNNIWITECERILKHGGTMWIFGTMHNIYSVGFTIKESKELKILNNITWIKKSPPPNLSCRYFTHSTETILWARKGLDSKHYFNYKLMKRKNDNKQMKDTWLIGRPKKNETMFGKHPTQKPEEVIERMILASSKKNNLILDPFCGSGTVGVVSFKNNRRFVGIDNNSEYIEISKKRMRI